MPTEPDYLNEFLTRTEPYMFCWRSLDVACLAARAGSDWIQFAGRATLSTEPYGADPNLKLIVNLPDFRAYAGRLEAKVIQVLVNNLRDSTVITGMPEAPVRLVQSDTQPYSWQQPYVWKGSPEIAFRRVWPSILEVNGTGSYAAFPFLTQNFWRDIDTKLRRHSPPFNGFASLCAQLGLQFEQTGSNAYFKLCAELPARFRAAEIIRRENNLKLSMEYVGTPELLIEWLPEHQTKREPISVEHTNEPGQFEVTVPIPKDATGVEARLLTMEMDADQVSLRVGWENMLLRICEFFDEDQVNLTRFLSTENNLKNVNPFEMGIARLLGLAGYTVLWFGKGAKEALPDLVAYAGRPLGKEQMIFGECTLKNPSEKLSDLSKRAGDLTKYLGLEDGRLLPVIFVRNDATDQDRQAANEMGLVLCDGHDIRKLHEKIKSDSNPEDVFHFLRSLRNITLISGGLSSLFS